LMDRLSSFLFLMSHHERLKARWYMKRK